MRWGPSGEINSKSSHIFWISQWIDCSFTSLLIAGPRQKINQDFLAFPRIPGADSRSAHLASPPPASQPLLQLGKASLRPAKLLNYSVEGFLEARWAKRLPINKPRRNQISLAILSRSCHTSWRQVWISIVFASTQETKIWENNSHAESAVKKKHWSRLTTRLGDERCRRQKLLVSGCSRVPPAHRNNSNLNNISIFLRSPRVLLVKRSLLHAALIKHSVFSSHFEVRGMKLWCALTYTEP